MKMISGAGAEERFDALVRAQGGWTLPVSDEKDMTDHIDRVTMLRGTTFTVDIKAAKALQRGDGPTQSELWIELYNVHGKPGWLFGKADAIAFELRMYEFLMVGRKILERVVRRVTDLDKHVEDPKDALYKTYSRKGRKDLLTRIRVEDILSVRHIIIRS